MTTAIAFLDYELQDDSTPYGGISFVNETLRDFLEEIDEPLDSNMVQVNEWLSECGIEPIKF